MTRTTGAADLLANALRRRGAPANVVFQITDRCHYDCIHCYETHGEQPELSLAEIERILDELAAAGTLFLTITGGEPFLRRDADEILRAARRRRFAVRVKTTGHFIDDRRADLIAELGCIGVDMSFYAGDPAVHDHVTRIRGSWQRTLDAARRLRARGVIVVLNSPVFGLNADELAEIARIAAELGCQHGFDPKVTARQDGASGPLALRAGDDALRCFYADGRTGVRGAVGKLFAALAPADLAARDREPVCRAALETCGITPQGLVTACHALPVPAGDLRRQSFREVWRGSAGLEQIRGLTWSRLEACSACDVRAYCQRCHAMALLEDGRLDGPSREACRHAVLIRDLLRDEGLVPAGETGLPPTMRLDAMRRPAPVRSPALRVLV